MRSSIRRGRIMTPIIPEAMDRAMQVESTMWASVSCSASKVSLRVRRAADARGACRSRTRRRPHTISVPRVKRADDIDPDEFGNGIDDETFAKICACLRLAVPYTGMIISTRESKATREGEVIRLWGDIQISGASKTSVGGSVLAEEENSAQFDVSDNRTLDEVVCWLMELRRSSRALRHGLVTGRAGRATDSWRCAKAADLPTAAIPTRW